MDFIHRSILLAFVLLITTPATFSQNQVTISGYIRDTSSKENIYWANILETNSSRGTVSNAYGFYSLPVPAGEVKLTVSYVGYQPETIALWLEKDTTINFNLYSNNKLDEVVVKASKVEEELRFLGHEQICMESIKELPAFLGEQDVLKALTVMPGVQQGHEGSSGIYVRGGSPDQNLILLDDVPVYNASHLFGFVSVFTPEALQRVDFYKGGFPARYGGRLSSVIDVRMKEGNRYKSQTDLTLGLISSKLTHEGPIKKGKSSYLISARRTLLDLLLTGAAKLSAQSSEASIVPGLNFYDFNGKANFDLNAKNRLYFSFYAGGDHLFSKFTDQYSYNNASTEQDSKVNLQWGNTIGAIRWNWQLSNKLFLNTTLSTGNFGYNIHNNYQQQTKIESGDESRVSSDIKYKTRVNNNKLKFLFDWYMSDKHKVQFGASGAINYFVPGKQEVSRNDGSSQTRGNEQSQNSEFSLFLDDQLRINELLQLYVGTRMDAYNISGELFSYFSPRLNVKLNPSQHYNINISYAEMAQPIHLLTNSSIGLPSDIWVPSTKNVRPEYSRQVSLGTTIKLSNEWSYSFDSYYKMMEGVLNYRAGYSFLDISDNWEELVEVGKGKAWGFENSLKYETSNLKTWLNYTLAWNQRHFENINNGRFFPFKFDRRHDINLGAVWQISKNTELSAMWVFQTGQAATVPQQDYLATGQIDYYIDDFITGMEIRDAERVQLIEGYNNYRLPAFHHLDIGLTFKKQSGKRLHEWKIGAYNVYSLQNPYMYFPRTDADGYRKYKQISIFPFLPSIGYHVKF